MTSSKTTVLVIGCGVAGPVLAVLLKRKGYHAIVFERFKEPKDGGGSVLLMPNGMKVFGLVGIANEITSKCLDVEFICEKTSAGHVLGLSNLWSTNRERYGYPMVGILRTLLLRILYDMMDNEGIEVRKGWELKEIEEESTGVKAHFSNGHSVLAAFLIGADGIKSATRRVILSKKNQVEGPPLFTGLSSIAGVSRMPQPLLSEPGFYQWYGNAKFTICYPISPTHTSWACTRPGRGGEATWALHHGDDLKRVQDNLLSDWEGWDPAVLEMIGSAERLISYGIYDRDELNADCWYSQRCVLIGDAAHPTSPHLGQGANQALEDTYHLSQALSDVSDSNVEISSFHLSEVFKAFAEKRQPRTAMLVKGARARGNERVVLGGLEACAERDRQLAARYQGMDAHVQMAKLNDALFGEPYDALKA